MVSYHVAGKPQDFINLPTLALDIVLSLLGGLLDYAGQLIPEIIDRVLFYQLV